MKRLMTIGLALLLHPQTAHACSVCFSATEENRMAFIGTTVFLTVLPLTMIGGTIWYLFKRAAKVAAEE